MRRVSPSEILRDGVAWHCGGEQVRAAVAGGAQAEHRCSWRRRRAVQRLEVEAVGDAFLAAGACRWRPRSFVEFGLAEQHDLQQLVRLRLEVGEQPDLLQRLGRHGVRLVDQHHDPLARGVALDQRVLQCAQHRMACVLPSAGMPAVRRRWRAGSPRATATGWRGRSVSTCSGRRSSSIAAQHGLAAADFAGDLDDALVVGDRVDQRLERRAAVGAGEEEIGVRRDAERRFAQAEVVEIHGSPERCQPSMRL